MLRQALARVATSKDCNNLLDCVATLASSPLLTWSFSILARVTSANPSHSAMLMVSSPKSRTLKFVGGGSTLHYKKMGVKPTKD
jgi:hypothetical protein